MSRLPVTCKRLSGTAFSIQRHVPKIHSLLVFSLCPKVCFDLQELGESFWTRASIVEVKMRIIACVIVCQRSHRFLFSFLSTGILDLPPHLIAHIFQGLEREYPVWIGSCSCWYISTFPFSSLSLPAKTLTLIVWSLNSCQKIGINCFLKQIVRHAWICHVLLVSLAWYFIISMNQRLQCFLLSKRKRNCTSSSLIYRSRRCLTCFDSERSCCPRCCDT